VPVYVCSPHVVCMWRVTNKRYAAIRIRAAKLGISSCGEEVVLTSRCHRALLWDARHLNRLGIAIVAKRLLNRGMPKVNPPTVAVMPVHLLPKVLGEAFTQSSRELRARRARQNTTASPA
jgi:hypothetical protein